MWRPRRRNLVSRSVCATSEPLTPAAMNLEVHEPEILSALRLTTKEKHP